MRKNKIIATFKGFGPRQWVLAGMFLFVLGFTSFFAFRAVRDAVYWRIHQDEPISPWMSIGFVAHSYHVPPHLLYKAIGLPAKPPDHRPLGRIAKEQNRSFEVVREELLDAIVHARPPYPPPTPPQEVEDAP